jgi:pimeloyl-ACP methyl ester carboxylesterase
VRGLALAAQHHVLPGSGHLFPLQEPERVAQAISNFVATTPRLNPGSVSAEFIR